MNDRPASIPTADRGRHMLDGALRGFLAESLFPLTGLITASFLTRKLLPTGYGLFTLVASFVAWVEWSVTAVFSRTTLKLIGEAADWRPLGARLVQLQLLLSVAVTVVLVCVAEPLAKILGEPTLTTYLRLMALEIPIFCLAQAHRNILIGLGGYRQRAVASVWRWTMRLVFIVTLVELGFSITGAILGNIGASIVELIAVRYYCRPPLVTASRFPLRQFTDYAIPLFLATMCMRLFDVQLLLLLKMLGGTSADVGRLGAAVNLTILPRLFTVAFAPLLIATLTHLQRDGQLQKAKDISRDTLRLVFFLLPFAGLAAGSGREITRLIFGPGFGAAGVLFGWLLFSAVAIVVVNNCASILTASGNPARTLYVAVPVLVLGVAGDVWLIPIWKAEGAVIATTGASMLGVVIALIVVWRTCQVGPALISLARSVVLTVAAFGIAAYWSTPGAWVAVKLTVLSALVVGGFFLLREFTEREVALVRSLLPWNRSAQS